MILVVDEALFDDTAVRDVDRVALLRLIALRAHGMRVQAAPRPGGSPSTPDTLERWRATLGGSLNREVNLLVRHIREFLPVEASARSGNRVLVSNRWEQRPESVVISLEEAVRVLGEPLHILVENALRDAAFLRRVLPPEWRSKLSTWEANGRVRFEHAGGLDEMIEIVAFMTESNGSQKTWGIPARAWTLLHYLVFDHDGDTAACCSTKAARLKTMCAGSNLADRFHMLNRRCQEYYLPRQVMEWIANRGITNPTERAQMLGLVGVFFTNDRTHGALPTLGSKRDFWKGRFWKHLDSDWPEEWFSADGSASEARQLAEAIERCL